MDGAVRMSLLQFTMVYLLLIIVLLVMKYSKIEKTRLLIIASLRMTVQLILAGLVLQYVFSMPHPLFTVGFIVAMIGFSINRVYETRKDLNRNFKIAIALSMAFSGLSVLVFFVTGVLGQNLFNPQYTIPLAGMIIGNSMTGVTLGLRAFMDGVKGDRRKIDTMVNLGIDFKVILRPYVNHALESALLPTINSMLGMGIIFLPGMMTGQILSGTLPMTAIMYQIAIMIAICTSVCLTVFFTLNAGYQSFYNERQQYIGP